ncbi:uncharacterized protein LOC114162359 isoform X3 [Vigna unguiculata]|uniref:uncharacterized protein LOC114162359 isoform X3 n=1 Tax=Vigna unguiculata TaxID=3917 RepID=UPI001016720B|nr:uncharacterized protein LOC114162359 isoform X3 [Vigna unguiculata]
MPGTIMVSVLEFMDLPLSSPTSIRASLGRIEYQVNDKENLSFPITSIRDDLIFKIQDAEGNEISRTGCFSVHILFELAFSKSDTVTSLTNEQMAGIQIKLILEKGVLEDKFPLGGGHLRLKLQVILSDEERDRIRSLRQSALKKKHDELLSGGRRGAESESRAVLGNAELPFRRNDEKLNSYDESHPTFPQRLFPDVLSAPSSQESPKKHLQQEAGSRDEKESDTRTQLEHKQLKPNIADEYKESSSTKPVSQQKGKKPAYQSPSEKHPQRATGSEEIAVFFGTEKNDAPASNVVQPNEEEGGPQHSEKRASLGRIPSNVRKMISAFEGGSAQDKRSQIKPPPTKQQQSSNERRYSSKTQHLEKDKSEKTEPADLHERVKSSSLNEAHVGTGTEGSKHERKVETKDSKPKTSDNNGDENSGGPFNQVVKVAIIVGFGLLVLLTRKRRKRMKKKNA